MSSPPFSGLVPASQNSKTRDARIGGILRDVAGCGFYRVIQPIQAIKNQGYMDSALGGIGCETDLYLMMEEADLLVFPRPSSESALATVRVLSEKGKRVVVDHDDNIFCVNPLSPHYLGYGTEEVVITIDGKEHKLWEDGKENNGIVFSIEENKRKIEAAKQAMREADAISVTTELLVDVYKEYNDNIYVLPNCVNLDIWQRVENFQPRGDVRVMWSGGASHYDDWLTIIDPLKKYIKKSPEVKLVIAGTMFSGLIKDIPDRVEHHPWVNVYAHPYKQALLDIDVGIIPLKCDEFGSGKSPIKYVEYSSLKIPTVAVNYPPYNVVIKDGENGFLYDTPEEFVDKLNRLVMDPALRRDMGEAAYKTVEENFDIRSQAIKWAEAYHEVIEG